MKRTAVEPIIDCLRFTSDARDSACRFHQISPRDWKRVQQWLDDASLAFYFLHKLKITNSIDAVPTSIVACMERNLAANRQRVRAMATRFGLINRSFDEAGVRYAVLKGQSMVPQFCPDATLRYQADFDYLVDDLSLPAAQKVLCRAGYRPKRQVTSREFSFVMPGAREPSRGAEQYSDGAGHSVELHLDIWDFELNRLPTIENLFSVERTRIQHWNGFAFPALTEEDAFLLQVLHTCRHLFTYWIRMACFYEIGYFLTKRTCDTALWTRIEEQVGENLVLREFVVLTAELVAQLFAAPLPSLVCEWGKRIRPGARVWLDNYGRSWALGDLPVYGLSLFPRSKLVVFLHKQYEGDSAEKHLVRNRLLTTSRVRSIGMSVRKNPFLILNRAWWKRHQLGRRVIFHALAALRYFCEIPRWRWLNRSRGRLTPSTSGRARFQSVAVLLKSAKDIENRP